MRFRADVEGRRVARAWLVWALLVGASAAGPAEAREASAGFAVNVRILGSAHAANGPKASPIPPTVSASSSLQELKVSLPTRAGYFVRFEIVDPAVQLVEIHGPDRVIPLASGAERMFVPPGQEEAITYRVKLRPGAHVARGAAVRVTLLP